MAYPDEDLNKAVEQSNAVLLARQAANPVIPNAVAQSGGDQQPMLGVDWAGYAGHNQPVIAAEVKEPRNAATTGPITAAARMNDETQSVPVPQATQDAVASSRRIANAPLSVVPGNPNYKAEYAIMQARERQDQLDASEGKSRQLAFDNARAVGYDQRIAAENHASFNRAPSLAESVVTNASTVNTGQPARGGAPMIGGGGLANDVVIREAGALAPRSGSRNFVQEELSIQQGEQARATGAVALEADRLKLENQKRLTSLGAELAAATDPKAREKLSSTILSLLGKDKPDEYQVMHAAGADTLAPDGTTKLKGADSVVVINKRTGAREVLQLGDKAAGPDLRGQAQAAVAQGADKAKVNERLKAQGLAPI